MYVMVSGEKIKSSAWAIQQDEYTGICVYADDDGTPIEVVLKSNELNQLATRANMLEMGIDPPGARERFVVHGEGTEFEDEESPLDPAEDGRTEMWKCGEHCCAGSANTECCGACY